MKAKEEFDVSRSYPLGHVEKNSHCKIQLVQVDPVIRLLTPLAALRESISKENAPTKTSSENTSTKGTGLARTGTCMYTYSIGDKV